MPEKYQLFVFFLGLDIRISMIQMLFTYAFSFCVYHTALPNGNYEETNFIFAWATYSTRKSIELPVLPLNEIVFLQCIRLSSTRSLQTDFGSCNFSAWFLYAKCKHTNEIFFNGWIKTAYKILCLIVIARNGFLCFEIRM